MILGLSVGGVTYIPHRDIASDSQAVYDAFLQNNENYFEGKEYTLQSEWNTSYYNSNGGGWSNEILTSGTKIKITGYFFSLSDTKTWVYDLRFQGGSNNYEHQYSLSTSEAIRLFNLN